MKYLQNILWICIVLFYTSTIAQESNSIDILTQNNKEIIVKLSLKDISIKEKNIRGEKYHFIKAPKLKPLYKQGAPEVLNISFSLIIPHKEWWNKTEIVSSDYTEYKDINLLPSKGVIFRNQDPESIPYKKGKEYNSNHFYPSQLITIRPAFIVRDYRGEPVSIQAIQYNPVKKILRIYHSLTIRISSKGEIGTNPLISSKRIIHTNREFSHLYSKLFLNYKTKERYASLKDEGNMLIICHQDFLSNIEDFANWKRQSGIPTKVVDLSTTGSTASDIKNYIKNYYETNGLTYVILVGDNDKIPSLSSHGDSDPAYAQIIGNDHYPDLIIGRFSGESNAQITTIAQKAIWYEKEITNNNDWLNKAIGISDNSNTAGDDNETDVQHMDNIRSQLTNYGYSHIDTAYEKYNINAKKLGEYINEGRGLINYVGHGSDDQWVTSSFANKHIDTLHNIKKLPFIFDVACVNGNFHDQTCFAEKWIRAQDNGQATGAVAIIASTVNQPWDPPMDGQDEMVDILTESYNDNIKRTFGGITYNGVMHMLDQYPQDNQGPLTADTWTIFGDPSLHIRTKNPQIVHISHPDSIVIGNNHFVVESDKDNIFIALSKVKNDTTILLGTGLIKDGYTSVSITPFIEIDTMIVTATGYNYVTVIDTVFVVNTDGPFIINNSFSINDSTENNNTQADFNENIYLNVSLKNIGVKTARHITTHIESSNPYINIINGNANFDTIIAKDSLLINKTFQLKIADNIPDQEPINIRLKIQYDTNQVYTTFLTFKANAPLFNIQLDNIKDSANGNNNGRLDTNETLRFSIKIKNTGHADATHTFLKASSLSSYFTFDIDSVFIDTLLTNATLFTDSLSGKVKTTVPLKTYAPFNFSVQSGMYKNTLNKSLPINLSVEDWERPSSNDFKWKFTGNLPWHKTATNVYEGDSSLISGKISNSQKSVLSIQMIIIESDTLSFYKKVSCEDSPSSNYGTWYDFLEFKIDNESKGKWDGNIEWSKESYLIDAGIHTFTWQYIKDDIDYAGQDCAWIDYIVFPSSTIHQTIITHQSSSSRTNYSVFPNPTKDRINIRYSLEKASLVSIDILSIDGKIIQNIIRSQQDIGDYTIQQRGLQLKKGIYFIRLKTRENIQIKKMIVE